MINSMLHSFILAQIFGLYFIIIAVIMMSRVAFYRKFIQNLQSDSAVVIVSGTMGLLLGLFLIDIHNIWVMKPRVFVTIVCWLIFIKSLLLLAMPEELLAWSRKVSAGMGYYFIVIFMAIFGIILLARSFPLYSAVMVH